MADLTAVHTGSPDLAAQPDPRMAPALADDPFATLNAQQCSAVDHGDAPLLIIAGAGSGKTLTLAARVARLVRDGADPQRLLLLTFSRRAAQELARRAGHLLLRALKLPATAHAPVLPWAGTFHAVGAQLLREYAPQIGLAPSFTIIDRGDAEDLMGLVRNEQGLAATQQRFPTKASCVAIYSRAVNSGEPLERLLQDHFPWCAMWAAELKALYRGFVAEKQRQHSLDYDDLLLYWAQMLDSAALARHVGERFDHVLVDEYQDTNRLQSRILRALKPTGRGLTVVGDDAQAIYSFRAADVRNILDFPAHFGGQALNAAMTPAPIPNHPLSCDAAPAPNGTASPSAVVDAEAPPAAPAASVTVITLSRNYRSTQPILAASNAVIARASHRYAKTLWTDRDAQERPQLVTVADDMAQARWVADTVLARREAGLRLKSQAVLFRTSHHSAPLELELARRNIPFVKFGGLKFLEAAHVKDVLAVLRWAQNPRARMAGLRVAQRVNGVGPASARRLLDAMDASIAPLQALCDFTPPAAARVAWAEFVALYRRLHDTALGEDDPSGKGGPSSSSSSGSSSSPSSASGPISTWPAELDWVQAWYRPILERLFDNAATRIEDLAQLARLAAASPSRERFITDLTLDPPEATSDEAGPPHKDDDYLILSTIHSAKGQEWQAVTVLNVVDGCIPADLGAGTSAELEEERRLLYVAMTRARHHLALMVPQRFYVSQQSRMGDRHVWGSLTRFIMGDTVNAFDRIGPAGTSSTGSHLDVDALAEAGSAQALPQIDVAAQLRSAWT